MPPTIMMFCGQGAQYYQMGRELHQQNAVFRRAMDRCDQVAGDISGKTVSGIIYGKPLSDTEGFDRLTETNPALLGVSYARAMTLLESGVMPDRLLGYSLGETIAAVVGGVLSLEDGFKLVHGQARLFEDLSPAGTMVAVLGDPARIQNCPEVLAFGEIAAINSPFHCVLSLRAKHLAALCSTLDRLEMTWARLPIRYPFHSAAIALLAEPMARLTSGFRFGPSRWPIISASTGGVVPRFDGEHIWRVMRDPLKFHDTIKSLAQEGEWVLLEAGPSGTLASFTRQIRAVGVTAWPSIDQFGQNSRTMQQLVAALP